MADDVVIRVTNVSKKFCRSLKKIMFYGARDITRNVVGLGSRSGELRSGEFWAVKDISFEVRRGETLGIIGPNGSGKSTSLKMLNGIFMPDSGKIEIKGRVGALIEVGAGFHPMLTGRENIYINGSILGMTKKEIDKKFDEIVAFAELREFIDTPVKYYSSGMYVRLGFSIAAYVEPDILLIDEVLAVGDFSFRARCSEKIRKLREKNCTVILVSHSMHLINRLCDKAIFLTKGELKAYGKPSGVIRAYSEAESKKRQIRLMSSNDNEYSSLPITEFYLNESSKYVKITKIEILDGFKKAKESFQSDEDVIFRVHYNALKKIVNPVFGIGLIRSDEIYCFCARTDFGNSTNHDIEGIGFFDVKIKKIRLNSGLYIPEAVIIDSIGGGVLAWYRNESFIVQSEAPPAPGRYPVFNADIEWLTQSYKN